MTAIRAMEHRIIQDLMQRRQEPATSGAGRWARRLITAASVGAGMLLLGSVFQELLWALIAGATVLTLGTPGGDA